MTVALNNDPNSQSVFSVEYTGSMKAVAFEANPELIPYLERSRQEHPSIEHTRIIHALVGEVDDNEQDFYVNDRWSGS